jgi:hypothetical protein
MVSGGQAAKPEEPQGTLATDEARSTGHGGRPCSRQTVGLGGPFSVEGPVAAMSGGARRQCAVRVAEPVERLLVGVGGTIVRVGARFQRLPQPLNRLLGSALGRIQLLGTAAVRRLLARAHGDDPFAQPYGPGGGLIGPPTGVFAAGHTMTSAP